MTDNLKVEIIIVKRDEKNGETLTCHYTGVPKSIYGKIRSELDVAWNEGQCAASFISEEDEPEDPYLEDDQGARKGGY